MKKTLLLFAACFFLISVQFSFAQNFWKEINSPTGINLDVEQFIDSSTGWVAGDSGLILHTTNGGVSWEHQNSKIISQISDLVFLNQNLGWGLSLKYISQPYGTYLLKTTNGGQDWDTTLFTGDNSFFNKIYWIDSTEGFLGGFSGTLLKTTNGGMSWYQTYVDTGVVSHLPILNFSFYNHQYGFACGGFIDFSGVVWKTTDGGESWYEKSVSADPIHSLHFFDSLNVIGAGGDFEFGTGTVRTTNGGLSWSYNSLQTYGIGLTMAFRNSSEAWMPLGFGMDIVSTTDSGKIWRSYKNQRQSQHVYNYAILDIVFPDSYTGYAVGNDGVILKHKENVASNTMNIISMNKTDSKSFSISQNYPNPFNPTTNIDYVVPKASHVELKVYNILGNLVQTLVSEFKQAGTYEASFNGRNLASGIYFYEFRAKNFVSVKKMILLR